MKGFNQLTFKQQKAVLNMRENFIGLGKSTNTTKGAKNWTDFAGHSRLVPISDSIRQEMVQRETAARAQIQAAIDRMAVENSANGGNH